MGISTHVSARPDCAPDTKMMVFVFFLSFFSSQTFLKIVGPHAASLAEHHVSMTPGWKRRRRVLCFRDSRVPAGIASAEKEE